MGIELHFCPGTLATAEFLGGELEREGEGRGESSESLWKLLHSKE